MDILQLFVRLWLDWVDKNTFFSFETLIFSVVFRLAAERRINGMNDMNVMTVTNLVAYTHTKLNNLL